MPGRELPLLCPRGRHSSLTAGGSDPILKVFSSHIGKQTFVSCFCSPREQPLSALLRGTWLPNGEDAEVELLGSGALGLPAILPIKEIVEEVDGLALKPKSRYITEEKLQEPLPLQNPGTSHLSCPIQPCG